MSSTIKLPITVAQIRDLAVAAGTVWPGWLVPDAPAYVVFNRGTERPCPDCGGTKTLLLATGRQIDCGCGNGRAWFSEWAVTRSQIRAHVVANGDGMSLHVTAFVIGHDPGITDIFPTLEAAQAAVRERNLLLEVDNG